MSLPLQLIKVVNTKTFLNPLSFTSIRHQSGHNLSEICADLMLPRCGKEALAQTECGKKLERGDKKEKKSTWLNPECCMDPCPDVLPRFDDLYYKPSDKFKRVYTQTWVECPKKRIVKKPVCDYGKFIYPVYERRPRKRSGKATSVCKISSDLGLMKCTRAMAQGACPKLLMPGCKGTREPPKCKKIRLKSNCKKICCPYPAFSECLRPRPKPRHPIECKCLDQIAMCDVWAEIRRRDELAAAKLNK